MKRIIVFTVSLLFASTLFAQTPTSKPKVTELVLLAGTIQPLLLHGGNFEVDVYTQKFVINYSHGFSLDVDNESGTTVGDIKDQSLALHLPYSTGFGIGYRLNKYFDIRIEPKLHKFEAYYEGTNRELAENQVTNYHTATLGFGTYFRWRPFEKSSGFLKGFTTSTSIRYWQNVWSSLEGNEVSYLNKVTDRPEKHKASNIGFANTPYIFNVALGYTLLL